MARTETNDRKRDEMKNIVAEVLGAKGYTITEVAAYMNVTPSCVSSWKNGRSMGTNDQRAELANIPARTSPESRVKLEKLLAKCETRAQEARDYIAARTIETCREEVRKYYARMVILYQKSIDRCAAIAAGTAPEPWPYHGYSTIVRPEYGNMTKHDYDVAYATKHRDEYLTKDIEPEAQCQAKAEWGHNELAAASKEIARFKKLLAKW